MSKGREHKIAGIHISSVDFLRYLAKLDRETRLNNLVFDENIRIIVENLPGVVHLRNDGPVGRSTPLWFQGSDCVRLYNC